MEIYSENEHVNIQSNAATVSAAAVNNEFQLRANVTFTGGASTAVTWSVAEADAARGSIDAGGNVTLTGTAGELKVTATSMWDPTVSNTVKFTIQA